MSDNTNYGEFIPNEDFPDFIIDVPISLQVISIFMRCYFNRRGLRFTRREMRYELVRYISFYRFPLSVVGIREFIRAGFYYSSYQDFVICYFCGYRRGNWQETDNPNDIHRHFSPNCIFFRQQPIENIQINETLQYLREYIRQNPTGPIYLSASSTTTTTTTTTFSYRESQQTESREIIRRLPRADLPGPPINRPFEVIHYGQFHLRLDLIRNPVIEMENRDQSQVHGELVNPLYEQSNPLSSEGFPALMYWNNHSPNSVTNLGQGYENRQSNQSTGDHSDSSQDTTALKTVFQQETESSDAVERSTILSQDQKLIKRTSRASSRLSSEGLQNGDVIQTVIKSNESNQVQEATDVKTVPLPKAKLHKESQGIDSTQETNQEREANQDIDTHQKTNQDIRFTKEILETPEDPVTEISIDRRQSNHSMCKSRPDSKNSRNLAQSTESYGQHSDDHQGFVKLAQNHTSTVNGFNASEQRKAIGRSLGSIQGNSSVPVEPYLPIQNRSPGTVHSILAKETDGFEQLRDAEQSDTDKDVHVSFLENERRSITSVCSTEDIGLKEENNEAVPMHSLQVCRTELRKQSNILQNSKLRIDETDFDQVEEVTEERKVPVAESELHNERQKIQISQETHWEIQNRQKTENNQVTPADLVHVADKRTGPMAKTKLHKESEEIDSNQETNQDREINQDKDTNQAPGTNHDKRLTKEVLETPEDPIKASNTEISNSRKQTNHRVFKSLSNNGNSQNLAQSTEPNEQQSDENQGFVELALNHTSTVDGYKQTEQRIATGLSPNFMQVISSVPTEPDTHTHSPGTIQSIKNKETDRFEQRRDSKQSDGPGLNYTMYNVSSLENEGRSDTNVSSTEDKGLEKENNETVLVHTLQANRTELRKQPTKLQNSDLKIDEKGFGKVEEVTEEKTVPKADAELHNERQEMQSNQDRETDMEIPNRQRTENDKVTPADLEFNQVQGVTDKKIDPMATPELHKESEEIYSNHEKPQDREADQHLDTHPETETNQDTDIHQVTETNKDIRLIKEVLETPEDPIKASNTEISNSRKQTNHRSLSNNGNSQNLAQSTEPNEQQSDEHQGFVELALNHTSTADGYKQTEQRIATGRSSSSMQVNRSLTAERAAYTQNRSPVHSIKTKETDRFEQRRDAEQSDTNKDRPGLNYTIYDMPSLENEGRSDTNVSSTTDIGLVKENNNTVSMHTLKTNRTELRQQPYKIQNSDLKIDTKGFDQVEEVTEERTDSKAEAKQHIERQEMQSNQDREAHIEIPNIQRTENNKDTQADLEFNQVQVTDKERTAPMAKAELHKEIEEVDSNQETNQARETNQDLDTHQATETNQDKDTHQVTETNKDIRLTKEVLEKPEDPITTGNKEKRISRRQSHHKVGRSPSNSGNSQNHTQTIEPNDQKSVEQPDFDLTQYYTSDVKGYKQTEQRLTSVPTLENEGSSFTDEFGIVDLGIEKENYKVDPVHTLQANICGLTKQPQKLEESIDETERQVVSEVGNTRTILDDRKPSRSLPNKHTNASAPPLNQSRKCKSLENNGKQADIKCKCRNLNQNGQPLVSAKDMRSLPVESGPQTGNRSPRPVYPETKNQREAEQSDTNNTIQETAGAAYQSTTILELKRLDVDKTEENDPQYSQDTPSAFNVKMRSMQGATGQFEEDGNVEERTNDNERRSGKGFQSTVKNEKITQAGQEKRVQQVNDIHRFEVNHEQNNLQEEEITGVKKFMSELYKNLIKIEDAKERETLMKELLEKSSM